MGYVDIADKTTLDKIYNYLVEANPVFGFIEHNNIMSPTARIEYIGANKDYTPVSLNKSTGVMSLNSWADFPVILGNKPYMVRSDGTPDYRLNENDYTLKEDGTESDIANLEYDGGAFAWLPKIYKQEYMQGEDRVVKFCMSPLDGFEPVGFVDASGNELEGLWIPMFYGSIDTNGKMRSLSGLQPSYNTTTAAEKTAIDAFSSRAVFLGGPAVETIADLLIMFAKSTNTQDAYGNGNMSGYSSSLAPTYGVLANAVVSGGQFYGTSDGKRLNKIFHSVVLGSWQQYQRDPYMLIVNGRVKVSKNYTYDLTGAAYQDTGITYETSSGWQYPHKYRTVPGFGAIPVHPFKGSTSTGGCDGIYANASGVRVALRFGGCNDGAIDGIRCRYVNGDAGYATWYFSASVLLLPPVGVAA